MFTDIPNAEIIQDNNLNALQPKLPLHTFWLL